jgi:hypothetical protein
MVYTIVVPTNPQYFSDQLIEYVEGQSWKATIVGSDGIVIAAPAAAVVEQPYASTRMVVYIGEGFRCNPYQRVGPRAQLGLGRPSRIGPPAIGVRGSEAG